MRLRDTGAFFCLNCQRTRAYERREWRLPDAARLNDRWHEFVLCKGCSLTFAPECLNESSVAYLEELMLDVPDRARYTSLRSTYPRPIGQVHGLTVQVEGYDDDGTATALLDHEEEVRVVPRQGSMIAYTSGRRH